MRTGLVLEGGAMRGLFTSGVIDVLMENGITFDGAVGVSAGACFGANYKSEQIGRAFRYNYNYRKDWRYKSWRSLLLTGDVFGADFCYRELPQKLDYFDIEAFEKNPMEFFSVSTDLNTGKPVYTKLTDGKDKDLDWIRASASMPLASRVVKIDNYSLLDGGITDSIPLEFMEKQGYEKNVVVLTQPMDYVKKPYKSIMPLFKLCLRKYPKAVEALRIRHDMYNKQVEHVKESEREGKAFVIRPPVGLNIGSLEHNGEEIKRVYELGRKTASVYLEDLKSFLIS